MVPARQRLETRNFSRFEIDKRLVEKLELVLVECPAELCLD
jgi:hypothetical protein